MGNRRKSAKVQNLDLKKTDHNKWKENIRKIYPISKMDAKPHVITCTNCLNSCRPQQHYFNKKGTHVAAFLLTPFLLFWLPYTLKQYKRIIHYCPICDALLGVTNR